MCYDCRLFYFHKASGTFQWDQRSQGLVDGTVIYLPPGSTVAVDGQAYCSQRLATPENQPIPGCGGNYSVTGR